MADVQLEASWKAALATEFEQPYFQALTQFVKQAYKAATCYPPAGKVFNAFEVTPLSAVRVVILGQDPYHGPGQAHGLSFSVQAGVAFPPSLRNIFTELKTDLGLPLPTNGDLTPWARQGVLLLNSVLTVRAGAAGSHAGRGWERFTDAAIQAVNQQCQHVVFLLWGSYAQRKAAFVDAHRHCVLSSPHPSPLSAHRGFLGSRPFSRANSYLIQQGHSPIHWAL